MKKFIYAYIRVLAILLIIVGLTFSITSLNKIYGVVFSNNIIYAEANLCLMFGGVLAPLFMTVIGLYIYFNVDYKPKDLKVIMTIFSLLFFAFGLLYVGSILLEYSGEITQMYYFLHEYYMYISIIIGALLMFGVIKYHYLVKTKRNYRKGMNKYGYKHLLWEIGAIYKYY